MKVRVLPLHTSSNLLDFMLLKLQKLFRKLCNHTDQELEELYIERLRGNSRSVDKELREKRIMDMKVGDSGFTLPWSVSLEENSRPWINGNYPVSAQGGTAQLKVMRTEEGYSAILYEKNCVFSIGGAGPDSWSNIPLLSVEKAEI